MCLLAFAMPLVVDRYRHVEADRAARRLGGAWLIQMDVPDMTKPSLFNSRVTLAIREIVD